MIDGQPKRVRKIISAFKAREKTLNSSGLVMPGNKASQRH
jgi:hypothetical protein